MDYLERPDGQLEPVHDTLDEPGMSTLELTGGTSPGHAQRLLDVLRGKGGA